MKNKDKESAELATKAAILLSDKNPILAAAIERVRYDEDARGAVTASQRKRAIKEAYDLSVETLRTWLRGDVTEADNHSIERIISAAETCGINLTYMDFTTEIDKYEFGEKFGFSRFDVQEIFDSQVFSQGAHFPGFYLSPSTAIELEGKFGGIYLIYFFAPDGRKNNEYVVCAAIRVRPRTHSGYKDMEFIHCKLHVPKPEGGYYPYDGVLTKLGEHFYWHFHETSDELEIDRDIVNIIIQGSGSPKPERLMGMYMSVDADQRIYSSSLVMVRQVPNNSKDLKEIQQIMRNKIGIYESKEFVSDHEDILNKLTPAYASIESI